MTSPNYVMVSGCKQILASMVPRYNVLKSIYTSLRSMRNIFYTWTRPSMQLCMFCLFISKSSLVEIYLSCSNYSSTSSLTWFLCLDSVSEPTDGILWVFTKEFRLFYIHAYEASMFPMNEARCFLFWINIHTLSFSRSTCGFIFLPRLSDVPLYHIF